MGIRYQWVSQITYIKIAKRASMALNGFYLCLHDLEQQSPYIA